jgi:hypothetical protein
MVELLLAGDEELLPRGGFVEDRGVPSASA